MHPLFGRLQPVEGVGDQREERDDYAHDDPRLLARTEPEDDQRHDGQDGHRLDDHHVGEDGPLEELGLAHKDGQRESDADGDDQTDEGHPGAGPQGLQRVGPIPPVQESHLDHLVDWSQQETTSFGQHAVGDVVPAPDQHDQDHHRWQGHF